MILVGLTGGIGSGKSTVSALLVERGAVLVDADQIVRDVQQPGSPVLGQLAERFGPTVLDDDGALDRGTLATIAFADADALKALNAIVHPAVGIEMARQVLAQRESDRVVVMDIPLLTESPREGLQATIVVDVPVETQLERLLRFRGFDEADARARIAKQATRDERLATATFVIDNGGDLESLVPQVDALWNSLLELPQLPADFEMPKPKPKPEPEPTPARTDPVDDEPAGE